MTETIPQRKWIKIFRKLLVAISITLLLGLLGLFSRIGYQVRSIEELSFNPTQLGFAEVVFYCDIIYNPILFPYYWLVGAGHSYGNFSMIFFPEAFSPGEFGGPIWGMKPQDRYDIYIMRMVMWGAIANISVLFYITVLIEAVGKRSLYLALFCAILGFAIASLVGMIVGLVVGVFLVAYIWFKMSSENFLVKYWESLWE